MAKPRARGLGVPFDGQPGPLNAITDIAGIEVGHRTLIEGEGIRTGVSAVFPQGRKHADEPVSAGFFSLNGCGEMTGVTWVEESGLLEGPMLLTNTFAVGTAHTAVIKWGKEHFPKSWGFALPVVGETYDGFLSDIRRFPVTEGHCTEALDGARGGAVEEGSVGGGTGMTTYDF
ncbi:MAG TPA: P1 family peptidase, partial [bacterium]|nr:P1 family peptidase [bacterium]